MQLIKQISIATNCDVLTPETILSVVFTSDKSCAQEHILYNDYKVECLGKLKTYVKIHSVKNGGFQQKSLLKFSEQAAKRGAELKGYQKSMNAQM